VKHHPEILRDAKLKKHFHEQMFHGFDFDNTMLRNRQHEHAATRRGEPRHPLSGLAGAGSCGKEEKYSLVLANPPFAGIARLREYRERSSTRSSRPRRPSCSSSHCFLRLLKPAAAPLLSFQTES